MQRNVISVDDLAVEYFTVGQGYPVLAFHGFGRSANDFEPFAALLAPNEMLVAINLFQHAGSRWPSNRKLIDGLSTQELKDVILHILAKYDAPRFSMLGYSMGGRIALTAIEHMASQIDKVLLMAPDGLKIATMYKFTAHNPLGRLLYRSLMNRPHLVLKSADLVKKIGLLNPKTHRFLYAHVDSKEKAKLVYEAWLIYRFCQPNLQEVARAIDQQKVAFTMIFGEFDSVIKPHFGKLLSQYLKDSTYHIVPSGHLLMTPETMKYIVENRLWTKHPEPNNTII
ncbi:MAG: alpha/beta fold hydrolase [Cryomorphaceae bacterium]|nr:alpha/beta fold hydrolase [Cryomorphaceae bacterium]